MNPTLTLSAARAGEAVAKASARPPKISLDFIAYLPCVHRFEGTDGSLRRARARRNSSRLCTNDQRDQFLSAAPIGPQVADLSSLAQDDCAIGEFDHVFHVVGDEDHGVALITELPDEVEDLARLAQTQGG